jgi:hypothetical protein
MRMTFLSILVYRKHEGLIEKLKESPDIKDNVFVQLSLGLMLLSEDFRLIESANFILHRNVGYRYGEFYKFILLDPLKAVYQLPNAFNDRKFIAYAIRSLPKHSLLFLSQKIGLFQFIGKPSKESRMLLKRYYGGYSFLIEFSRAMLNLVPSPIVRYIFMLMLCSIHGLRKGPSVYKTLLNRAHKDNRETAFTSYN